MKTTKIAVFVLILLFAAILTNSIMISRITDRLSGKVDAIDCEDTESAAREYENLSKEFKKAEKYISLTVSHDDLTNIEESFAEIIGAAKAGNEIGLITLKSRLRDSLEHLGRLSSINLDSIL